MMKQHKGKLLISSLLILLPSLLGLILWKKLPEQIAIHWGLDGNPDAWGKPVLFLLLLPLFLLALHWLALWLTALDHRKKPQSTKVYGMVFWIMPFISLYVLAVLYATAFGSTFNFMMVTGFLFGVLFLIIGNYLPKCRPNRTIGIRIIWTLISEENWVVTHRFAGKVTVICGLLCCVISFLPTMWFFLAFLLVILSMALIPGIYSYGYYRKQRREGRLESTDYPEKARDQKSARFSLVVSLLILAQMAAQLHIIAAAEHKQACNHKRLRLGTFSLVLSGLEGLVRIPGETVQVQTVIPVCTTDQRQHVRTQIIHHMIE